jgi:hypothetical protein
MVTNSPPKFPDMRPPPGAASLVPSLPTPAGYRRAMPLIGAPDPGLPTPRSERKRRVIWFAVAVALHAALLLGIWLMPPLRLKWSPSPEDWVQVVSLPKPAVPKPAAPKLNAHQPVAPPLPDSRHKTEGQTPP